jgi:hypothetical protein
LTRSFKRKKEYLLDHKEDVEDDVRERLLSSIEKQSQVLLSINLTIDEIKNPPLQNGVISSAALEKNTTTTTTLDKF